jgi:hypothetical protein
MPSQTLDMDLTTPSFPARIIQQDDKETGLTAARSRSTGRVPTSGNLPESHREEDLSGGYTGFYTPLVRAKEPGVAARKFLNFKKLQLVYGSGKIFFSILYTKIVSCL